MGTPPANSRAQGRSMSGTLELLRDLAMGLQLTV